jgi:hypothetical protein
LWPQLQALHGGFKINPRRQKRMFLQKLEIHPIVLHKVPKLAVLVAQRQGQVALKGRLP